MEPQERDLITTLLTRLKDAGGQPKDTDADALIRQAMTQMPDAPYYLVQTVLIQDLSLHNAQNRIADLERQVASLSAPPQRTSFLGGLLGGGSQPAAPSAPQSGPWTRAPQAPPPGYAQGGYAPQPGYAQPGYAQPGYAQPGAAPAGGGMFGGGGNSFLKSAAATAAGVAGGALLFEGISSLFGHGYASGLGGFGGMGMGGMGMGGMGMGGGISETVINNNYGGSDGGYAGGDAGGGDSGGAWSGGDGGGYAGGGSDGGYDGGSYDSGASYDSGDSGGGYDGGDSGGGDGGGSSSC